MVDIKPARNVKILNKNRRTLDRIGPNEPKSLGARFLRVRHRLFGVILCVSVFVSASVLLDSGLIPRWGQWYSLDLTLRQQSCSLLCGRLNLSESVAAAEHDQVWDNGRLQQVWGLGVPVWRIPFELSMRLLSALFRGLDEEAKYSVHPDRIAFGVAVAIVVFFVLLTFTVTQEGRDLYAWERHLYEYCEKITAVLLLALFPPFLTLLHQRFGVYQEVQAYSYLTGIILLAGTILFVRNPRFWLFVLVATGGGFAAFVRPTAGVFGIAALVVMLVRSLGIGWPWWRFAVGVSLFVVGWLMLYFTNWLRFGSGMEFGHSLNLNHIPTMRFAGRFGAPYSSEPFLSALRELASLLFMSEGYISETLRWRRVSFTSYNLTYAFPLIMVSIWFLIRCRRMLCVRKFKFGEKEVLAFWCIFCTASLFAFYLRFPFMNSRYLLDFAPGFAGGVLVFVYLLRDWGVSRFGKRFQFILFSGVLFWWGFHLIFVLEGTRASIRNTAITHENLIQRMELPHRSYRNFPEYYETGMPFQEYQNQFNGSGWDSSSGKTWASIALFVEDPEFLELTVAPEVQSVLSQKDYEIIQAKVALEFLEMESMTPTDDGMVLRFSGPKRTRYQDGIQVAFVAFMTVEELHEGTSRFRLLRVRWRHASLDTESRI